MSAAAWFAGEEAQQSAGWSVPKMVVSQGLRREQKMGVWDASRWPNPRLSPRAQSLHYLEASV